MTIVIRRLIYVVLVMVVILMLGYDGYRDTGRWFG